MPRLYEASERKPGGARTITSVHGASGRRIGRTKKGAPKRDPLSPGKAGQSLKVTSAPSTRPLLIDEKVDPAKKGSGETLPSV